jgi:hypothetical protein
VSINDNTSHYAYYNAISVEPRPTMEVNIYNQCSNFKLTNREHFSNGIVLNNYPDLEVDTGSMMSTNVKSFLAAFEGALTYMLQRGDANPGSQPDSIHILFFVAWKSEGYKKFRVFIQLIEYDEQVKWNENKLEEYYQKCVNQFCTYTGPIKDTWFLDDDIVLITELDLDFTQRDGRLNITISDKHTKRPKLIDSKM